MERSKVTYALVALAIFVGFQFLPAEWFNRVVGGYWIGGALLLVLGAVASAAFAGFSALRRRRNIQRNPLDPDLRPLVMSDLAWENVAQAPDAFGPLLEAFRFLVEREGFAPARVDREFLSLLFRRSDEAVSVGYAPGPEGPLPMAQAHILRGPNSFVPLATEAFSDEGIRALAFEVASRLDQVLAHLRFQSLQRANPPLQADDNRSGGTDWRRQKTDGAPQHPQ